MSDMSMRLKAIVYGSDFRKSDATLYADFCKSKQFPGRLNRDEVYLFVSGMENQLIWFLTSVETETVTGKQMFFTDSRRWRFSRRTRWDPSLLTHYARACGINLVGVKTFKQAFTENRSDRLEREREARAERRKRVKKAFADAQAPARKAI